MPVRIYALAKELDLDSKDLVDICKKAGITGKGSALASLSDDEATKVKDYLKGPKDGGGAGKAAAKQAEEEARPISRDDYIAPASSAGSKVKVLDPKPKRRAVLSIPGKTVQDDPAEEVEVGPGGRRLCDGFLERFASSVGPVDAR